MASPVPLIAMIFTSAQNAGTSPASCREHGIWISQIARVEGRKRVVHRAGIVSHTLCPCRYPRHRQGTPASSLSTMRVPCRSAYIRWRTIRQRRHTKSRKYREFDADRQCMGRCPLSSSTARTGIGHRARPNRVWGMAFSRISKVPDCPFYHSDDRDHLMTRAQRLARNYSLPEAGINGVPPSHRSTMSPSHPPSRA